MSHGKYKNENTNEKAAEYKRKKHWKTGKKAVLVMVLCGVLFLTGCENPLWAGKEEEEAAVDFTILSKEVIPEEVLAEIEKRGTEPFQFTFQDHENMYVCVGYGAQKGQGYSICVEECTRKADLLYINMTLLGPEPGKGSNRGISYPYIVIQTEGTDLPVMVE